VRIGVVSDTHNSLRNVERIVELFNTAGVARVFHTGDITQAKTLVVLSRLAAPLAGVYGNNDQERDALEQAARDHGMALVHGALSLTVASRRIAVVHDPREIDAKLAAAHDLVLHGHTHRLTLERRAGALVFNPGECAGFLPGHNAVGVVDLDKLEVELLRF
jgi:putative phosphoesterase